MADRIQDDRMSVTMASSASITFTHRDQSGNAGMTEKLGDHPTVDVAKGYAEAYARCTRPHPNFHWRQFSPTTWGLMDGQLYTFILISWIEPTA